jgi:hypothetical protein
LKLLDKTYFIIENKTGLSKVYNKFLYNDLRANHIIYIHDDMWIDDAGFITKLEEGHVNYDIIGLAGGVQPVIKEPALWHIMCGGFQGNNLRGFAGHFSPDQKMTSITNFGPSPARVAVIDGAFMSINAKKVREANWKFNELPTLNELSEALFPTVHWTESLLLNLILVLVVLLFSVNKSAGVIVPIPTLLPKIVNRVVSVVWKNIEPEPLAFIFKFWLSEVLISLRDGVESYDDPISIPPILVLKAAFASVKKYRLFIPPPYIDCTLIFPFTSND